MKPAAPGPSAPLIVQGLGVHAGPRCLLELPSLLLWPGRVHAILGPNGAGKSTLLAALAGASPAGRHCVHWEGRPLGRWLPASLARRRALLPQHHHVPAGYRAAEVVALGRHPHRHQPHPEEPLLIERALARAGATGLGPRLYESLSGGERARVQLARALAQIEPAPTSQEAARWLLLDEPAAALDLAHQHELMRLCSRLASEGVGVIIVMHDLNLAARYANEVLILSRGHMVACGPAPEVLDAPCIEAVWGLRCHEVATAANAGQHAHRHRSFIFG